SRRRVDVAFYTTITGGSMKRDPPCEGSIGPLCQHPISPSAWLKRQLAIRGLDEFLLQLLECMHRRELREFGDDIVWRVEEDAGVGLTEHGGVVVRVTGRDHAVVKTLERQY